MLGAEQMKEFERDGIVKVPGAFGADDAARMRDVLWGELAKRHGMDREDRSTWTTPRPTGLKNIKRHAAYDAIGGQGDDQKAAIQVRRADDHQGRGDGGRQSRDQHHHPCLSERDAQLARDRRQETGTNSLVTMTAAPSERDNTPSQVRKVGCRPTEPLETVAVVVT
ncbi:hypothetical protein ACFPJ1_21695 [Kribbella qitaiheensis]|uniref:hypothetical protein n=1 Tax=Kribbella qitaiheensis TaxID=1544730 RepID=UPI003623C06E